MQEIPFNRPFLTGKESSYLEKAVETGKISGNGVFSKKCHTRLVELFQCKKALLTTSCTDALEMAAILTEIKPGDEVIMPSFTFVSTANAFILRGAKIVFVDSRPDHPGMDEEAIEELITPKTRAIVCVHYAGVACDMDKLVKIAEQYNLFLIEDAAQCIDSYYQKDGAERKTLGSIGDLGTLSFHETKNIQSGEGGALLVNNPAFIDRSEIIWEKGTNRTAFWRGEIDKYGWVDIGSSFLPSELTAAFLFAQLEEVQTIQKKRKRIWHSYNDELSPLMEKGLVRTPYIPEYATNNAHMYYLVCESLKQRTELIAHLKKVGISSVFHYQPLHKSSYFEAFCDERELKNTDTYGDCLVRLPMHLFLNQGAVEKVSHHIKEFFGEY